MDKTETIPINVTAEEFGRLYSSFDAHLCVDDPNETTIVINGVHFRTDLAQYRAFKLQSLLNSGFFSERTKMQIVDRIHTLNREANNLLPQMSDADAAKRTEGV